MDSIMVSCLLQYKSATQVKPNSSNAALAIKVIQKQSSIKEIKKDCMKMQSFKFLIPVLL
jgi:hypothetical protein